MASILMESGFKNLESLQDFCTRFPNVTACLDSDLKKVWICHKNVQNIPKFEENNSFQHEDYVGLCKKVKRKIARQKDFQLLLTEFSPLAIFDKIYLHFKIQLTAYIFTQCYVFYNWGINAFEPVIDHFEIHKSIEQTSKKPVRLKRKIRCNYFNRQTAHSKKSIQETENQQKNVKELSGCSTSKGVSYKAVKGIIEKSERFFDLSKNANNPFHETFNLKGILYDLKQRPQWSRNHILSKNNVTELLIFVIKIPIRSKLSLGEKLLCEHEKWLVLRELLGIFLKNHKAVEKNNGYGRILKRHLKKGMIVSPGRRLLPIPKSIVASYLVDILRKVLPLELFGRNHIRKKFLSSLAKLINATKEENFIWHQFLSVLLRNKSDLTWCSEMKDNYVEMQMLLKLFKFIVIHYVFLIIKNNFYVTETGSSGFSLNYYRKSDMESASSACLNKLLFYKKIRRFNKGDYEVFSIERKWMDTGVIDDVDLKKKSMKTMSRGTEYRQPIASVRFLPKNESSDELRIITKIITKSKKNQTLKKKKLIKLFVARHAWRKRRLFFVKLLLEFLVDRIGFGIKPVPNNPKLVAAWNKAIELKETHGKLYFVKADIADAFGSVRHDVLSDILQKTLEEESLQESIQLKRIIEWKRTKAKVEKAVRFSFSNRPKENCVLINRSIFLHHKKKINQYYDCKFVDILRQIVTEQRIEIKGKVFKLVRGLAQGSAGRFSPNLCEIYYSSMDKLYFGEFVGSSHCVLLRGVDDYLFITADAEKCMAFLKIIRGGIEQFNARFNKKKLKSNLIDDVWEVPYLGLIFNFDDMSVKPNYSKYEGRSLLSTMKLNDTWGNVHFNKERFLERRSLYVSCLKLQPILLSKSHNTLKTVRQTIFQACLFQALRVMTLAGHLYQGRLKNDLSVFEILLRSCNKIRNLVYHSCGLSGDEVEWLFFFATLNIFRQRSGEFKSLLVIVKYHLQKCEKAFVNNGAGLLLDFIKDDALDVCRWERLKSIFGKLENKLLKS